MTSASPRVPPLTVPQRHVSAFETLRAMEDNDFLALLGALAAEDATVQGEALAKSVRQDSQQDLSAVSDLLDAIMSLAAIGYRTRESNSHMAKRVACSSQFSSDDGPDQRFSTRIEGLLECEAIRLQSKALAIGATHERIFANAQVITDLRPIFNEDINQSPDPEAAQLSHTLSLHFISSDGSHDNFYIALDDDDILTMQQVLERAAIKSRSLRQFLQASGIIHIKSSE